MLKNDPIAKDYLAKGEYDHYGTYFHNRVFKRMKSLNINGLEIDKNIIRPGTNGGKNNIRRPDFQWKKGTPDYEIWDIKSSQFSGSSQFDDIKAWTGIDPIELRYHR